MSSTTLLPRRRNRGLTTLVCPFVLALLTVHPARAQDVARTIRSLDSAWARTYATHDTTLARKLFAPDLIVTSANGTLKDLNGELGDIRPQAGLQMEYFRTVTPTIRVYDGAAVVTGLAEWRFTYNGQVNNARRRYTSVFVKGGPLGWRIAALHMGRAPDP